jgi:hypothetical protein
MKKKKQKKTEVNAKGGDRLCTRSGWFDLHQNNADSVNHVALRRAVNNARLAV